MEEGPFEQKKVLYLRFPPINKRGKRDGVFRISYLANSNGLFLIWRDGAYPDFSGWTVMVFKDQRVRRG